MHEQVMQEEAKQKPESWRLCTWFPNLVIWSLLCSQLNLTMIGKWHTNKKRNMDGNTLFMRLENWSIGKTCSANPISLNSDKRRPNVSHFLNNFLKPKLTKKKLLKQRLLILITTSSLRGKLEKHLLQPLLEKWLTQLLTLCQHTKTLLLLSHQPTIFFLQRFSSSMSSWK